MFVIAKETLFFVKLRQAYLLSPAMESRLSTRTILFTDIPDDWLQESKLRSKFPQVRHIWMSTNTKDLQDLVEEREEMAIKLEGAEIKLSKQANKQRLKNKQEPANAPDRFLDGVKRPTHRLKVLKFLPLGEKVDTIDYCRKRISELTPQIEHQQASHWQGNEKHVGAAFIEFETVAAAQMVWQSKDQKHFEARAIGQPPDQIIFANLHMKKAARTTLRLIVDLIICALIIFWAIP
jgi:hypothetical protein